MQQVLKRREGHGARGQSTLEYILVLAAILVGVILAANNIIRGGVNTMMTNARDTMTGATGRLQSDIGLRGGAAPNAPGAPAGPAAPAAPPGG